MKRRLGKNLFLIVSLFLLFSGAVIFTLIAQIKDIHFNREVIESIVTIFGILGGLITIIELVMQIRSMKTEAQEKIDRENQLEDERLNQRFQILQTQIDALSIRVTTQENNATKDAESQARTVEIIYNNRQRMMVLEARVEASSKLERVQDRIAQLGQQMAVLSGHVLGQATDNEDDLDE